MTDASTGPRTGVGAPGKRARTMKIARWAIAAVALAFVAWIVPVRDVCWDPRAPTSTRAPVSRLAGAGGCVLHIRTGDVTLDEGSCASLQCEPGAVSTIGRARPGVLAARLLLYAFGTLAWAARWRTLLGFAGVEMKLSEVWRVSIEAQAGGVVLPGGIGGDALRIASVAARLPRIVDPRARVSVAAASVLLDRAVGLAVVSGLAAAMAFVWSGVHAGALPVVLAGLPVAFAAGVTLVRRAPIERIPWLVRGRLGGVTAPVLAYVRDPRAPRAILSAALLGTVVAGVQLATVRGLVFALGGAPTAEKWVYVGVAMAFVVSALPTLPGAWGTADAAYVFFFGFAGLPSGIALAVCLLYRLFWYLSAIAGAVLHLVRPHAPAEASGGGSRVKPPE